MQRGIVRINGKTLPQYGDGINRAPGGMVDQACEQEILGRPSIGRPANGQNSGLGFGGFGQSPFRVGFVR